MRVCWSWMVAAAFGSSCTRPNYVQCDDVSDCSYLPGGQCTPNPATGSQWCTEPDPTCPSGLRWGDIAVRDGLAGMCVASGSDDADPGPPADGPATDARVCARRIAFLSERTGNFDIFATNPDGSSQINLTSTSADEGFLNGGWVRWSPTGDRIAYVRDNADLSVWVMSADGSGQAPRTSMFFDGAPAWAPDGSRIAFVRTDFAGPRDTIWVVDAAGPGAPVKLSTTLTGSDSQVSWSPDGTQLAFVSTRDGNNEIYTMLANGSGQTNRTNHNLDDGVDDAPQWSPDGSALLFLSRRTGNADVWTMNADGTNPTNLTLSNEAEGSPRWSPDGTRIAFVRNPSSTSADLYVMNADGSGQAPLQQVAGEDRDPAWSSDGTQIAFTSYRDSNFEIYVVNADGSNPVRVTNHAQRDQTPAWQPCL